MRIKNYLFVLPILFLVMVCNSQTQQEQTVNELVDITVDTEKNLVTITCKDLPQFNKFYLDSPPRIVVDVKNCVLKFDKEMLPVAESKYIQRVRVRQFKTQPEKVVRVVVDLFKKCPYEVKTVEENKITVSLSVPKLQLKEKVESKTEEQTSTVEVSTVPQVAVEQPAKVEPKEEQPTLEKPAPVKEVAKQKEMEISSLTVKELPLTPSQSPKKQVETKKVEEEKPQQVLPKTLITLEVVDADIQDVLQMLAVKSGVNIIYGPDVTGKVTISLKNVPFDKAFENILRISKLVYVPVGDNIVRVGTPQVIEQERSLQVVYTKIFPLNYAVADEVKAHLDQIRQAEGRTKGTIIVDKRTNSLIVTESEEGLKYIEEWIKKLDTKPYQVSIEAQVIDISVDDLAELGIQWGVRSVETKPGSGVSYTLEGTGGAGVTVKSVDATAKEVQSGMLIAPTGAPIESAVFLFGKFTDALSITGRLAMLITQGKAKVLSNPRVTTINNKTATIIAGEKIPYKSAVTQTTTGGAGVGQTVQEQWEYITAGIQLTVTPTVSPDGWITLTVKPQVDIPQISAPGVPPTVKSRQTEVTVMVRNNEPLVIGGLISDSDIEAIKKLPLLGDLPILGYLFKYKTTTKKRTELIILITPRIVEG